MGGGDGENNLAWPFWEEEKGRRARLLDGKNVEGRDQIRR